MPTLTTTVVLSDLPTGATQALSQAAQYVFLVQTVKDAPALNPDGTPELDGNQQPILVAFFAQATIITVTTP